MRIRKLNERKNTCSKCNSIIEESRIGQRYCKVCHAENMRKTRKKFVDLDPIEKKKATCRSFTHTYVKKGNLIKEPCYNCGNEQVEAHHSDYDNPLKVHWVCRECHLEMHENKELEEKVNSMPSTEVLKRHPMVHKILKTITE